jgi:hypothetical protein
MNNFDDFGGTMRPDVDDDITTLKQEFKQILNEVYDEASVEGNVYIKYR